MMKRVAAKVKRALKNRRIVGSGVLLVILSAIGLMRLSPEPISRAELDRLYETPLPAPEAGISVFHLGHSLVNRNMPDMIWQIAEDQGVQHRYDSQIGWGTPLKSHFEPSEEIFGFAQENDHARYRDVFEALESGDYDAFVLTEMVEIRDAIAYFDSAEYVAKFAERARAGRADVRVYLYETWHEVTDPEGWRVRLELDRARYWEDGILRVALAHGQVMVPIYVIPVGQVFAEVARQIEAGSLPGLTATEDIFARTETGDLDPIHVDHLGNYIAALTHYAALYQRSPVGVTNTVNLYDEGTRFSVEDQSLAATLQGIVWDVVRRDPLTGLGGDL
jgi:hypothetical protein